MEVGFPLPGSKRRELDPEDFLTISPSKRPERLHASREGEARLSSSSTESIWSGGIDSQGQV